MNNCTIYFLPSGRSVTVSGGTVYEAMIQAGLYPNAPCGGSGSCGKCKVEIHGKTVLACRTPADHSMIVSIPAEQLQILTSNGSIHTGGDAEHEYVLALDLGTTTIAGAVLDGKTGRILAESGCVNPQRAWGADVITRIRYTLREDPDKLRNSVRIALSGLTAELAAKAEIDPAQISLACMVCNTAMHHLLLGIDLSPLVTPPYMPAVREALEIFPDGILPIGGSIRILPNIAGFIGADTTGCMIAAKLDQEKAITLLLDIGTNGEMVLGNKEHRIACSAAAGPAFEGAGISCGMSANKGAVDHVWLENEDVHYSVIGNCEPKGLCGSGLMDLAAVLLKLKIIDASGRMKGKTFTIPGTHISLTQKDIRQLQLAKGAIRAGIELMAEHMGIPFSDIEQVKLAGAFGNYLNPESAVAIGMIPEELKDRIIPIGNAAFAGAKICALRQERFEMSKQLSQQTSFLELASVPSFQSRFISCLNFPT